MPRYATRRISGWGNFPVEECQLYRPEKPGDLRAIIAGGNGVPDVISRGLGRSYGDAALNRGSGVILHTRLNRFIDFDPQAGLLECEAGVSLAEILEVFLPRGFFPPVTPGTKFVTVGGAIAADVHGKNHHQDGSIGPFISDFQLQTANGEVLTCSRDQNADAFRATFGGMGLTGAILSARLRLRAVESAWINVDYQRAANLDQALESFSSGDARYQYSVAWIDCLAGGAKLGRSVLMRGNHAAAGDLPESLRSNPLKIRAKRKRSVPFNMPGFALNSLSVRAFNAAFYKKHKDGRKLIDYDSFFYPLDSTLHWNRMYGKRGFVQYQAAFPAATSRAGLVELLEKLSASKRASFLAVLKTFGPAGEGLLSFPIPGQTLALDLPNTGPDLHDFLRALDEIVLKHGGRVYLAKDACLSPAAFRQMYPNLDEFRRIKRQLDPSGRFNSSLAKRLEIAGES